MKCKIQKIRSENKRNQQTEKTDDQRMKQRKRGKFKLKN